MEDIDTNVSQEEFECYLDKIFDSMKTLLIKKNRSYGGASFQGGKMALIGNSVRLQDKENRYLHLIKNMIDTGDTGDEFGESVMDTLKDMFGYSCIGIIIASKLKLGNIGDKK